MYQSLDMSTPAEVSTGKDLGLGMAFNVESMRPTQELQANALLRRYEWEEIDQAVIDVARTQLVGIKDLMDLGLTKNLADLGSIYSVYEQLGDMSPAIIDMGGDTEGQEDRVSFTPVIVPVPIIHKPFRISIRNLMASRRNREGNDVVQVKTATRRVRDSLEALLFNGTGAPVINGNTIYGYTNHPSRNTGSADGDWGTVTNIFPTVTSMISAAESAGYYGPYGLYAARTQHNQALARFNDGSGETAKASVMRNLDQIQFFKPADSLADGSLVLVTLVSDVVDLAIAQDITAVEWESKGGMVAHYKVMAAMAPRIKSDANGSSGIVHFTGA